jgi:hypothetical protein
MVQHRTGINQSELLIQNSPHIFVRTECAFHKEAALPVIYKFDRFYGRSRIITFIDDVEFGKHRSIFPCKWPI